MKRLWSFSVLAAASLSAGLFTLNVSAQSAASSTSAASPPPQCILAGRLDSDQRWAPQARGVELLDAAGKRVSAAGKDALMQVKAVRLTQPALLSTCNGNQSLPEGDANPAKKSPVPALSAKAAPIPVQAVAYPPMRVGGNLVELQLLVPADRVIELTR